MNKRLLPLLLLGPVIILGSWWTVDAGGRQSNRISHGSKLAPPSVGGSKLDVRRNLIVRAVQRVKGAVVNIHSERTLRGNSLEFDNLSQRNNRVNGMGTGIIIDPRGYIITNYHVVEDVSVIRVRLADGTTTNASVVARDRQVDLAMLRISTSKPLPTIPLGASQDLMVGEDVIAVGNAFGYEHTVSRGIVSAVKRDVSLNKEISYRSLIQTDASINPGNSGGPLVNVHGELVGVNVAIRAGAQGIGFAIPVETMIRTAAVMMRSQRGSTAQEGMTVKDMTWFGTDGAERRVVVSTVTSNGPAEKVGIKSGDEIVKISGLPIKCSYDVQRAFLGRRPGDSVQVVVRREGKMVKRELSLSNIVRGRPNLANLVWAKLGLRVSPIAKTGVTRVNPQLNGGLQVVALRKGSVAQRAGIQLGDIVVGLHRWETLTLDNVAFVLMHPDLASFNPLEFYIIRDGQVRKGLLRQVD